MARNIKRIVTFGDSFVAGDELLQDKYITELTAIVNKYPSLYVSDSGKIETTKNKNTREPARLVNKFIEDNEGGPVAVWANQYKLTFGYKLAEKLNVPAINYARGANSNIGIFKNIVDNIENLDSETFVIIGSTFIGRTSRLVNSSADSDEVYNELFSYTSFLPHVAPGNRSKEHELFRELDSEFGDDWYFRYLQYFAQLEAIKYMLESRNIPFYFIDTVDAHSEKQFKTTFDVYSDDNVNYKAQHLAISAKVVGYFIPRGLIDSADIIKETGKKHSQFFGHFSEKAHAHYADYLYDKMKRDNII